jgi:hypothetical protein
MFIIANHTIQDPDGFWDLVKKGAGNIPPHLKLHAMFPSTNALRSVCLWEAESPEAVNEFLRSAVGDRSKDEFYEVNKEMAIGLPVLNKAATV